MCNRCVKRDSTEQHMSQSYSALSNREYQSLHSDCLVTDLLKDILLLVLGAGKLVL